MGLCIRPANPRCAPNREGPHAWCWAAPRRSTEARVRPGRQIPGRRPKVGWSAGPQLRAAKLARPEGGPEAAGDRRSLPPCEAFHVIAPKTRRAPAAETTLAAGETSTWIGLPAGPETP